MDYGIGRIFIYCRYIHKIGQNNNPPNPIAAFRLPEAAALVASIRDDWSMEEFMKAQQRDPLLTEISDIVGRDQVGSRVDMINQSKVVKVTLKENLTWFPEGVLQRIAPSGLFAKCCTVDVSCRNITSCPR